MNLRTKFDTSLLVGMAAMVLVSSLLGLLPRASADNVTVNSSSAVTFLNSGFVVGERDIVAAAQAFLFTDHFLETSDVHATRMNHEFGWIGAAADHRQFGG